MRGPLRSHRTTGADGYLSACVCCECLFVCYQSWNSIGCLTRRLDFGEGCLPFELPFEKDVVDCKRGNSFSFFECFELCFDGLNRFTSCLWRSCSLAVGIGHLRRGFSVAAPEKVPPVQTQIC